MLKLFGINNLLKPKPHWESLGLEMSKQTSKKKGKITTEKDSEKEKINVPVSLDKNGNICIKISAKPGAKSNTITGIEEEGVGVQISAPPVEGEANTELVKFLASILGLRKSCVSLDRGSKSRQKTILLTDSNLSVSQVIEKLNESIGK